MADKKRTGIKADRGKLRIGNDWNAISIIALSQNNPLKAIAEFIENSIDAGAKNVTVVRGKEKRHQYLKIMDDGEGIPLTSEGVPDFKYVATHICDSLKRRLKEEGAQFIQGEFGIGLLSFWTVGHRLTMLSSGRDGKAYQMTMEKDKPGYSITCRAHLVPEKGTQLIIAPILVGLRLLTGEKIQRYLASELRDRIRTSNVKIRVIDRTGRAEYDVEPRQYSGSLLHNLPPVTTTWGDIYAELYVNEKNSENRISLFRSGTRVLPDITTLEIFQKAPWNMGYFQGIIDAPFLSITPGTRDGIIHDERFAHLCEKLAPLAERLSVIADDQSKAEDERMSKNILRSVQKAFRDAILALPEEDYDWFGIYAKNLRPAGSISPSGTYKYAGLALAADEAELGSVRNTQKQFFEIAGPLFSARISPCSSIIQTNGIKKFRAVGLDKSRRQIESGLIYEWGITEGCGILDSENREIVEFRAPNEPGLVQLKLIVRQGETTCRTESVITVVETIVKQAAGEEEGLSAKRGLPVYTLESAAGQTWRSRFDEKRNVIIVNSGHRDFIYAGRERIRKLRYICRLFSKELILNNFSGTSAGELLERLIELSMYTEDNLK